MSQSLEYLASQQLSIDYINLTIILITSLQSLYAVVLICFLYYFFEIPSSQYADSFKECTSFIARAIISYYLYNRPPIIWTNVNILIFFLIYNYLTIDPYSGGCHYKYWVDIQFVHEICLWQSF